MSYLGFFLKYSIEISINILMMQVVWKIRGILLQIFVWIVDLKVKERLTEHLKKDTKYRRVTIGVNA